MSRGYTLTQTGSEVQEILNEVEDKTIYDLVSHIDDGLMSKEDKRILDEDVPQEALTYAEIDRLINF